MEQMTIAMLAELCQREIKAGNGNKKIVVSDDNEGNGYHGLFYGFTTELEDFKDEIYDSAEENIDNLVILG